VKNILVFTAVLLFVTTASAQAAPIKVRVLYDATYATSSTVAPLLIRKFAAQPTLFTVVNSNERNLSIIVDCPVQSVNNSYSCFYAANKWMGSSQAFLGGAGIVTSSAEDAANALFTSIMLVLERWNSTDRRMLISELESCLTLTKSSCAVPESLMPELKVKSINLGQYHRIGGLKP
jgi:opacity protein-like surface antigen